MPRLNGNLKDACIVTRGVPSGKWKFLAFQSKVFSRMFCTDFVRFLGKGAASQAAEELGVAKRTARSLLKEIPAQPRGNGSQPNVVSKIPLSSAGASLRSLCRSFSFAPLGLALVPLSTHGLRRGLHSFAAPRLHSVSLVHLSDDHRAMTQTPQGLKPACLLALGGTAEAVPYPKPNFETRSSVVRRK
jgi:hypothetical protein